LPLFVNFCIGLFTDKAAEWASNEHFKIPQTCTTTEEVFAALLSMISGAFKDKSIVRTAKENVKSFKGHGLTWTQFRLEFETLCRRAEISIYGRGSASLVAEFFRDTLNTSNTRTLKTTPPAGMEKCVDPEDLTIEEMYDILEDRWYIQYPKKDFRGGKAPAVSMRAAPIEKIVAAFPPTVPADCRGPLAQGGNDVKSRELKDRLKAASRCWFCRRTGCPGSPAGAHTPDQAAKDGMGLCPQFKKLAVRGAAIED
jgi:hypothetical protein